MFNVEEDQSVLAVLGVSCPVFVGLLTFLCIFVPVLMLCSFQPLITTFGNLSLVMAHFHPVLSVTDHSKKMAALLL